MALLGLVSATPVVGASDIVLDTDTTSEPVPDWVDGWPTAVSS